MLLATPSQRPFAAESGVLWLTAPRFAIGIVGDAGVRGTAQQPRLFVGMILILIFAEVLGTIPANVCWYCRELV